MTVQFTVMTWNVENLFPVGSPSGPKTQADLDRKLDNLASVILGLAPAVLALQEIGDPATLSALQTRLQGKYLHSLLSSHPDPRGIRVGFLSGSQLTGVEELVNFPSGSLGDVPDGDGGTLHRMGRGALKADFRVAGGPTVSIVTAHLKSKLLTFPGGRRFPRDENERARGMGLSLLRRAAEAVALRVFVNRLVTGNDQPLILLGDLNDGPDAVTTQTLEGPEDLSLSHPDKFDDVRLYNLAEYIPVDRRYSRIYRNRKELIDHIMVSHDLIFHRRQVDSFVDRISGIDESTEKRRDAHFPDHAPVYARFEM